MKNVYIRPQCVNASFPDTTVSYKKMMKMNTHRKYALNVDIPVLLLSAAPARGWGPVALFAAACHPRVIASVTLSTWLCCGSGGCWGVQSCLWIRGLEVPVVRFYLNGSDTKWLLLSLNSYCLFSSITILD